jgi:hypothetical protein
MKAELTPAVAADGHDGHGLLNPWCRRDQLPEDPVEAIRESSECRAPSVPSEDVFAQLAASLAQDAGDGRGG